MKKISLLLFLLIGLLLSSCDPIENQEFVEIPKNSTERSKHSRYSLVDTITNNFNKEKGVINLMIPITERKLKAVYCENVSSDKLAAIVVVLDGAGGGLTNYEPVVGFRKMELSIKKLKLDTDILNNSLKVFILHDNRYKEDKLKDVFKKCVQDADSYSEIKCSLKEILGPITINNVPREQGGDIIPPTGG